MKTSDIINFLQYVGTLERLTKYLKHQASRNALKSSILGSVR